MPNTHAIIFVVDSSNREKLNEAKELLYTYLRHEHLRTVPLLLVANKQDLSGAVNLDELIILFELHDLNPDLKNRSYKIIATSALNGSGIEASLEWLSSLF